MCLSWFDKKKFSQYWWADNQLLCYKAGSDELREFSELLKIILFPCISSNDQIVFIYIAEDSAEPTPRSFKILLLGDAASDEHLIQACQVSYLLKIRV